MTKAWAVKNKNGDLIVRTVARTRKAAVDRMVGPEAGRDARWRRFRVEGWTVVPVQLTEVTEISA